MNITVSPSAPEAEDHAPAALTASLEDRRRGRLSALGFANGLDDANGGEEAGSRVQPDHGEQDFMNAHNKNSELIMRGANTA